MISSRFQTSGIDQEYGNYYQNNNPHQIYGKGSIRGIRQSLTEIFLYVLRIAKRASSL